MTIYPSNLPTLTLLLLIALSLCTPSFVRAATNATRPLQCVPPPGVRDCPSGQFDNGNLCIPCPPGSISKRGASSCTPCPPGTASQNGVACGKCEKGTYVSAGRACVQCPTSTYSDRLHSRACTSCPTNHTTILPDFGGYRRSDCFSCRAGLYLSFGSYNRCRSCSAGQYNPKANQLHCRACPPGHGDIGKERYAPTSLKNCDACPPGTYSKYFKNGAFKYRRCTRCPFGTYANDMKMAECKACPSGTFSVKDRTRCVPRCDLSEQSCRATACPPGTQPNTVTGSSPACVKCPPGTTNPRFSVTQCVSCTAPLVASWNRLHCVCTGNRVYRLFSEGCDRCPSFSTKRNNKCVCAPGQQFDGYHCRCQPLYKAVGRKCVKCSEEDLRESRTSRGFANFNQCNLCTDGTFYSPASGRCEACAPGFTTYGQTDKTRCEKCRETHVTADGEKVCGCKPGTRRIRDGVCQACPAGEALDEYGGCEKCGYETYSDKPGLAACKKCPEGRRYSYAGKQTACPPACPANASASGGRCVCDEAFIQRGTRARPSCKPCGPDEVRQGGYDGKKCVCKEGYGRNNGRCKPCPPGTYGRGGVCRKCAVNEVTTISGQRYCRRCKAGNYSICTGGTKCVWCKKGSFVTAAGKCGKCKTGFVVRNGRCRKCTQGFSPGGDASACTPCPTGKKVSADGGQCV